MNDIERREEIQSRVSALLKELRLPESAFETTLVGEMIYTCVRLFDDDHSTQQLKLINRTLREMRKAYKVFNQYPDQRRLAIFGSARTPEDHPDYEAAKKFGEEMAKRGWMCITGAANGIMKAGHEGASKESSFGLSIRLAFESIANEVIEGDPKHLTFRYFFTRKLMFVTHSDAVAVFPGGFGTNDELFEVLTLMQTGKSQLVPVVLVQGEGKSYWEAFDRYVKEALLSTGFISEEDLAFYKIASSVEEAAKYIERFYKRYHSSRFVGERLVIRLNQPLSDEELQSINEEFKDILLSDRFSQGKALSEEREFEELSRLIFHFNRRHMGRLRELIDRVNNF